MRAAWTRLAMISLSLCGCDQVFGLDRPDAPVQYVTFVQVNAEVPADATTVLVTYLGAQTAANLNVAAVGWSSGTSTIVSIADQNGPYKLAVAPMRQGIHQQAIYYQGDIKDAAPGVNVVTVTFSELTDYPDIRIAEYSGIVRDDPFDVGTSAVGNSTLMNSGNVVTTHAHELLVGASLVAGGTLAPGIGWTGRIITSPDGDILQDMEVRESGPYAATALQNSAQDWVMQLAAFRGY